MLIPIRCILYTSYRALQDIQAIAEILRKPDLFFFNICLSYKDLGHLLFDMSEHAEETNDQNNFDLKHRLQALEAENAKLKEDQFLFNTLLENVADSIYFKDRDSKFLKCSTSLAALFGLRSAEEAIGKSDHDFFDQSHADKARSDEQDIMESGKAKVAMEEDLTMMDGRKRWDSTSKIPLLDKDGNNIGIFGISRDITNRKNLELEMQESLLQLKKENQKLLSILNYTTQYLMSPVGKAADLACIINNTPDQAPQHGGNLLKYLQQSMNHFKDLADYASIQSGSFVLHQAKFCLFDLFREIRPALKQWINMKDIRLHFKIPRELQLKADCKYISRVLYHLILHSIKETPKEGDITLEAIQEGDTSTIRISDTAKPLEASVMTLFDHTVKDEEEQTQSPPLGMLLTAEILNLHRCHTTVTRQNEQGNCIEFQLPVAPPPDKKTKSN